MNQLKIDLLFKNSHYKFSWEIAISPKLVMQQEKHINKAFRENTCILLKSNMEIIILMFLLAFCLQIQLFISMELFYLLTRKVHPDRYSLYPHLNFLPRKKCHFSICAVGKGLLLLFFPWAPGDVLSLLNLIAKARAKWVSLGKLLSSLLCASKGCCVLKRELILHHKSQIIHWCTSESFHRSVCNPKSMKCWGSPFQCLAVKHFSILQEDLMKRKVASNRERQQPAAQSFVHGEDSKHGPTLHCGGLRMSHHKYSSQQTCWPKCLPFTQIPPVVSPYLSHLRTDLTKNNREKREIITYIKDF